MGANRQDVQVRHRPRVARRSRTSSEGVRSCSSITSCSGPITRPDVPPARRLRMASTGSRSISPTTTSCSGPCRGRRSRSCWPTSVEWAGRFRGHRRTARTSTPTSRSASPSSSSAREASNTTTAARSRFPAAAKERRSSRRRAGTDAATFTRERPGISAFVLEDGVVYHTYSAYARGVDGVWGMYQWLDRAPKGRNEQDAWWKRHDEYASGARLME